MSNPAKKHLLEQLEKAKGEMKALNVSNISLSGNGTRADVMPANLDSKLHFKLNGVTVFANNEKSLKLARTLMNARSRSRSPGRKSSAKSPARKSPGRKSPARKSSKSATRKSPARKSSKSPTRKTEKAPRVPGGNNSLRARLARKVEKAHAKKKILDISNINRQTGKGYKTFEPYTEIGRKRSNKKYLDGFPVASNDASVYRWFIETIGDEKNMKYIDIFEHIYGKGKVTKTKSKKNANAKKSPVRRVKSASPRKAFPRKSAQKSPRKSLRKSPRRPNTVDSKKKFQQNLPR